MSKSRLEKFLYALYSLDSSDLPTPLSRIEELYKCWVTGEEAPTFKPISRVEKYLMAILGVYDVELLPNPLSRVEVLLCKLATGDDNLNNIDSFLSEHEELLAEIIRNGGDGGNIDIEYVLYNLSTEFNTLYNTAEKPVKSVILKGNTLVNLFDGEKMALNESAHYTYSNGIIKSAGDGQPWSSKTNMGSAIKPMTKYLLKVKNVGEYALNVQIRFVLSSLYLNQPVSVGQEVIKIIETGEEIDGLYVKVYPQVTGDGLFAQAKLNIIEYQDGMENWDIPYFEGMGSVKMPVLTTTGKNLFDGIWSATDIAYGGQNIWCENYIEVNSNVTYYYSRALNDSGWNCTRQYDDDFNLIEASNMGFAGGKITLEPNTKYIKIATHKMYIDEPLMISATKEEYEPYKSNILTVNEPIELRGIGDVKDELDLLTGELTQRIGEIVLDGSENEWLKSGGNINESRYAMALKIENAKLRTKTKNDRFVDGDMSKTDVLNYVYGVSNFGGIVIAVDNNKLETIDSSGFKKWLSQNPITIQYQLATESIKTVDLSVVDQNGNNAELSTFNDITHVALSSEGLIPEAELKVVTKNEEVLNTMSLEMDDISTTQNTLEETSNVQSENVDSTMIATTEIYEELL